MRDWGIRGGGVAAKRQPSVRTDDSAAEVSLEYLPTPSRGQRERRGKAGTAARLAKMTTQRHTHKAGQALRPPRASLKALSIWERIRFTHESRQSPALLVPTQTQG